MNNRNLTLNQAFYTHIANYIKTEDAKVLESIAKILGERFALIGNNLFQPIFYDIQKMLEAKQITRETAERLTFNLFSTIFSRISMPARPRIDWAIIKFLQSPQVLECYYEKLFSSESHIKLSSLICNSKVTGITQISDLDNQHSMLLVYKGFVQKAFNKKRITSELHKKSMDFIHAAIIKIKPQIQPPAESKAVKPEANCHRFFEHLRLHSAFAPSWSNPAFNGQHQAAALAHEAGFLQDGIEEKPEVPLGKISFS